MEYIIYYLKSAKSTIYIFQHIIPSIFNDLQYMSISITGVSTMENNCQPIKER